MRTSATYVLIAATAALAPGAADAGSTRCGGIRPGTSNAATFDKATAACPWPFNVEEVLLTCYDLRPDPAIVATVKGRRYALNDAGIIWGRAAGFTLEPADAIRLTEARKPHRPVSLKPWIDDAATMCRKE